MNKLDGPSRKIDLKPSEIRKVLACIELREERMQQQYDDKDNAASVRAMCGVEKDELREIRKKFE